jgi:hypothetical protein
MFFPVRPSHSKTITRLPKRHGQGAVRFHSKRSGLRKLMRAMRCGTLDPEHQRDIRLAEGAARDRRHKYMSKSAREREMLAMFEPIVL